MEILEVPNDAPPIEGVWMWVSRDREGRENVIGSAILGLGVQPLVTGNPVTLLLMRSHANAARRQLERLGKTDQTIHMLRFTRREEIEEW